MGWAASSFPPTRTREKAPRGLATCPHQPWTRRHLVSPARPQSWEKETAAVHRPRSVVFGHSCPQTVSGLSVPARISSIYPASFSRRSRVNKRVLQGAREVNAGGLGALWSLLDSSALLCSMKQPQTMAQRLSGPMERHSRTQAAGQPRQPSSGQARKAVASSTWAPLHDGGPPAARPREAGPGEARLGEAS